MAIVNYTKSRGEKMFRVLVRNPDGGWYPSLSFSRLEDAKDEEIRLMRLKRSGVKSVSRDAKMTSLLEFWEVWSIENRSEISKGWQISQDQMWKSYILPTIGSLKLSQIEAPEIGRVLNYARKLGRSEQTVKHVYSLLGTIFNSAVHYYKMLPASPVNPKFHRPKVKSSNRTFLEPAQAWRLLEAVKEHYLGPAIWIETLAGLRPSEIQALKGEALNFDQDQILICAAYNNKTRKIQNFPKQGGWAYAPMIPPLKEYLISLKARPDEYVCKSRSGMRLSYHTLLPALKRICKKVGIPEVTPHELRHSCTELWIQAGASTEDIRRLLNHSSLNSTKHYIHRTDSRLNAIGSKMSGPGLRVIEGEKAEDVTWNVTSM